MIIDRTTPLELLPAYLRVEETAQFLGCSRYMVYELIKSGALVGTRFGRLLRVQKEALLAVNKR